MPTQARTAREESATPNREIEAQTDEDLKKLLSEQEAKDTPLLARLADLDNSLALIPVLESLTTRTQAEDEELQTLNSLGTLVGRIKKALGNRKRMQSELAAAPAAAKRLASTLNTALPAVDLDSSADWNADRIKSKVGEIDAQLTAAEALTTGLDAEDTSRASRQIELPKLLSIEHTRLAAIELPDPPAASAKLATRITYQISLAERLLIQTSIAELELEQFYLRLSEDLFLLKKRMAVRQLAQLRREKTAWDEFFKRRYAEETAAAQRFAELQASRFTEVAILAKLTLANSGLADLRARISTKSSEANTSASKMAAQERIIEDQRTTAQERITLLESAGLKIDTPTGKLLRDQRAKLPTPRALVAKLNASIRESTRAQVQLIEMRDRREKLPVDQEAEVSRILETIQEEDRVTEREPTIIERNEIREILVQRRTLMTATIDDYKTYISALNKTSTATRLTIDEVESYSSYLDERLLWIPSAAKIALKDFPLEIAEGAKLVSAASFKEWFDALFADLKSNPAVWLVIEGILIYLIFRRRKILTKLAQRSETASMPSCSRFMPTLQAIWLSVQLVAPIVLALWFLTSRVQDPVGIVGGLQEVLLFFAIFSTLSVLSRPEGLLPNHFNMDQDASQHLHYHLRWLLILAPMPIFFSTGLQIAAVDHPQVGRIAFLIATILTVIFAHLVLRPGKKLIAGRDGQNPEFAKACWLTGLALPTVFIIGTCLGYSVSIDALEQQAISSLILILTVLFVASFLLRWLWVSQIRVKQLRAEQKQAATDAASKEHDKGQKPKRSRNAVSDDAVSEQTTRLVRVGSMVVIAFGLWTIFSSSLTALSVLDRVKLWEGGKAQPESITTEGKDANIKSPPEKDAGPESEKVDGDSATPDTAGDEVVTVITTDGNIIDPRAHWVTLQDLLSAIIIVILTVIIARNLSGLLELTILRRFSSRPGANYATTTLLTYAIIAGGIMLALSRIGVTWSSLQWLAAAITLGIGFGLQEIFANFVAGIILLFERPIRLDDVVTVGGVTGKVTRIEIRATTILKYNNVEMLVPNKDLITGTLFNHTLKDNVQRFEFPVEVAYESDPDEVTAILKALLEAHPNVIEAPAPSVLFRDFGNNTLNFEIRAHVASPDDLLGTQSQLHFQIEKAFRKAGITFAFPQQDLHIRTMPETDKKQEEDKPQPNSHSIAV